MSKPLKPILVVLCIVSSATSQTPQWSNYTAGKFVNAIVQEGDNLWVGTDGGLVLYTISTGQSQFLNKANSGLGYNIVNAIAIDRNGKKWIATGAGMCTFDGVTWKRYLAADGLTEYNFTSVAIERAPAGDTVWIGFYGGLARFDGKSFKIFTTQEGLPDWLVTSIAIGADGTKWLGTSGAGLAKFNGSIFTSYNLSNSGIPYNSVKDVLLDGADVWVATDGLGAAKFDGTNWTVYNKTTTSGALLSNYVRAIRKGAGNALYFCTEGGLAKFDAGQWVTYKHTAGGLPSDTVTTLLFVAPNTVYAGTPSAGMVSFNGVSWTTRSTSSCPLPSNWITKIHVDANNVKWIGTDAGIVKIDGTSWGVFNSSNSIMTNDHVSYLATDNQGRVLVATNGTGVYRWNGTAWENLPNSSELNQITAFGVDGKNRLWASASGWGGGFGYNDGSGWRWFPAATTVGGITIPYGATRSIIVEKAAIADSESVWIGIDGGGIVKVTGNAWTLYNHLNSGLVHVAVMSMDFENGGPSKQGGALWVATWGGGVFRFNGKTWTQFTAGPNAVPHKDVGVVMVDGRRNKWIGTFGLGSARDIEGGIVKLDTNSRFIARYNTSTSSLPGNYITDIKEDKLGIKWIGTYGWGLAVLDDRSAATDIPPDHAPVLPRFMQLFQNYPNPFNPTTAISYQLSAVGMVTLRVYDILGSEIATVVHGVQAAGTHTVHWSASTFPSGVYYYRLQVRPLAGQQGTLIESRKMVLVR
jgi:ligand-binding sensor domain-containing protein